MVIGLSDLDPLKWIDDMLAMWTQGPSHKIEWYYQTGQAGGQIEKDLRYYGVIVFGRSYVKDTGEGKIYSLHVRKTQAAWAVTLLKTMGVPIRSGDIPSAKPLKSGLPARTWKSVAKPVGLGGLINDIFMGSPSRMKKKAPGKNGKKSGGLFSDLLGGV